MNLPQTETEYLNALVDAAELGAMRMAEAAGILKPFLNERQARAIYGSNVKKWEEAGLIHPQQDGPNKMKRYSRMRLEALAKASHYSTINKKQ